jgi:formamidopyrimidine-DNA glycosylase
MPELPEVETTRLGISPYVINQQITDVHVRERRFRWPMPDDLETKLKGRTVTQVGRRAKYLLLQCDDGFLMIHLGMSGRLRILDNTDNVAKHDHVDILFGNGKVMRFTDPRRFGAMLWTDTPPEQHALIHHLGPEPLSDAFDKDYLFQQAKGRKVAIKVFIMNGEVVVGVGNIYANEALFLSGISPQRAASSLNIDEMELLTAAIKQVLSQAIKAGGTTLRDFRKSDGKPGYFNQELHVYGRADKPCTRCKTPVSSIRQAQRATYFCPSCQR